MRVLIKQTAVATGNLTTPKFRDWLLSVRGGWVDIDTNHLFNNQYNTVDGFRIYDTHIERIEDDVRHGLAKCGYCGNLHDDNLPCLRHGECVNYKQDKFSSAFFVRFPNGHDKVLDIDITNRNHRKDGFYSFYSVNGNYYRISRRSNIEFVLADGEPYIVNGIGYKRAKFTGLSNNEHRILKKCIALIPQNEYEQL